jgi:hypothetical protein
VRGKDDAYADETAEAPEEGYPKLGGDHVTETDDTPGEEVAVS